MSGRKIAVGCALTAGIFVVLIVVVAVIVFRQLSALAPLPEPSALVDVDTLGIAVAHLEPDNPWIKGFLEEWEKNSFRRSNADKILPIDLAWASRSAGPGSERHLLRLSLAPRGKLVGLVSDLALWRAGRSGKKTVSREEYRGEGITSFPGLPIRGFFFVQENSIFWASDQEGAHLAVDGVAGRAPAVKTAAGTTPPGRASLLALLPTGRSHALAGALINLNGSLDRSLMLILTVPSGTPGATDAPLMSLSAISFVLDPTTPDEGAGEITLHFPDGTPPDTVQQETREVARRISSLSFAKVSLQVDPLPPTAGARLAVRATGLQSIYGRLASEFFGLTRTIERLAKEDGRRGDALPDPNQSSSTFQ